MKSAALTPVLACLLLASPAAAAPRLAFELRTQETFTKSEGGGARVEGKLPENSDRRTRVVLTPDSVSWLDLESNRETVLDRKRRELVFFDHDQKTVKVRPFLGWIAALDQEHQHRKSQAKALEAAGLKGKSFETFWIESLFRAGNETKDEVKREGTTFRRGEETVLSFTPGKTEIPAPLRASWKLFLVRTLRIHSAVRAPLAALETLPDRIAYRCYNVGYRVDAVLETKAAGDEPAPVDRAEARKTYGAWFDAGDQLDVLLDDIAQKRVGKKVPTQKEYGDLVTKRAKEGAHLDAFLLLVEGSFAYPAIPMRQLAASIDMQGDEVRPFLQILQTVQSDPAEAAAAIAKIDRKGLQGDATLDAMLANALQRLDKPVAAEALYIGLLRQKPWLAGPWKDLGDLYVGRFQTMKAWRCWDRAIELAPRHPLLRGPIGLRQHLERQYADWLKE